MTTARRPTNDDSAIEKGLDGARDTIADAADHPLVEAGARLGYGANAVMHLVIAFIAVQLALGHYSGNADQSGALGMLAESTWGVLLLWVGVIGWALLAVWQLGESVLPWAKATDRLKAVSKTVVYGFLAWTCFTFARHHGRSSTKQNIDMTKGLVDSWWGRTLLVIGALVIIGVGVYHVLKGWKEKFLEDLREHPGRPVVLAGRIGYLAKGVAIVIVGLLVLKAALMAQAAKASGLDGAFRTVLEAPFGRGIVALVGLGFAAYAVYSLGRARYARV